MCFAGVLTSLTTFSCTLQEKLSLQEQDKTNRRQIGGLFTNTTLNSNYKKIPYKTSLKSKYKSKISTSLFKFDKICKTTQKHKNDLMVSTLCILLLVRMIQQVLYVISVIVYVF